MFRKNFAFGQIPKKFPKISNLIEFFEIFEKKKKIFENFVQNRNFS